MVPPINILVVGDEIQEGGERFVGLLRLKAAIVEGELFEVTDDAQGQLSRPSVAPKLHRWGYISGYVHRRLLRFQKELAGTTYIEAVVGCFGAAPDLELIFFYYLPVCFRVSLTVVNVPTKLFQKGVNKIASYLSLIKPVA